MVSPHSGSIVKNLLETSKRLLEKAKTKKGPITPDHFAALVNKFGNAEARIQRIHVYWLYALSLYAGLLRFNELSNIKRKDIVFYDAYAKREKKEKKGEKTKRDVYREWKVSIAKTGNYTCPVSMLLRYIQKAKIT